MNERDHAGERRPSALGCRRRTTPQGGFHDDDAARCLSLPGARGALPSLRTVATIIRILAYLVAIIGAIGVIIGAIAAIGQGVLGQGLLVLVGGLLYVAVIALFLSRTRSSSGSSSPTRTIRG